MGEGKASSAGPAVRIFRLFRLGAIVLFVPAAAIMALNIAGLFLSLRNPEIRNEKSLFKDDITIGLPEVWDAIERRPGEEQSAYVRRLTGVVNQSMAHYWSDRAIDKYNLRVPLWENFILYCMSYYMPHPFLKYEFRDYRKALERGVGLCSQHAMVLTEILREQGIPAHILYLHEHVVARVEVEKDRWIIADPDYGIIIPHDISRIRADSEVVIPYYQAVKKKYRPGKSGYSPEKMAEIYRFENNLLITTGAKGYMGATRYNFERRSYLAKWIVPAVLMLPALLLFAKRLLWRS